MDQTYWSVHSDQGSFYDDDESRDIPDGVPPWKSHLYFAQQRAPKPQEIVCTRPMPNKPSQYGKEYHGLISRDEAEDLVMKFEGLYLTRERQTGPGTFALTFRINNEPKHYRLYYDRQEKQHYVGEKRFDTVHDLVEDGLITMYVEFNERDYISQMTLNIPRKRLSSVNLVEKEEKQQVDGNDNHLIVPNRRPPEMKEVIVPKSTSTFKASECEKPHNFNVHSFPLAWCNYCMDFMWGLKNNGVLCSDCAYECHKHCGQLVQHDCSPDKKRVKRVFGVDLTTLIKAHDQRRPEIIDKCIQEIETRGLDVEGIYRIPGFADDITELKNAIDKDGIFPDLSPEAVADINVICGLFKLYLRSLPLPVIPYDVYDRFIQTAKVAERSDMIKSLSEDIAVLPRAHYETLKYVCRHLQQVSRFKDKNLMSTENLGIVFGPTLMRAPDHLALEGVGNIHFQKKIIQVLIEEQDVLFDP